MGSCRGVTWSEGLAWAALLGLLVFTVPLLVCLPLTLDTIAYDVCARTVLRGGVLYRDAWDNNLPGAVWVHCGVRGLFGDRSEVLRGFDLVVVGGVIGLLVLGRAREGQSRTPGIVTATLLFAFYSSRWEWCQCQRDTWMLLPALAALQLRRGQVDRLRNPSAGPGRLLVGAIAEGAIWGAAFWIKPFVAVPALACWLAGVWLVRGAPVGVKRRLGVDAAGLLLGGLLAGAAGIAWLYRSGAWPAFWDVFSRWNREYYAGISLSFRLQKLADAAGRFFPWWLVLLAAVPVALAALRRAVSPAQALLAAFFLGCTLQAFLLQRPLDYIFVPPILIGIALVAGVRLSLPVRRLAGVGLAIFIALAVWTHPLLPRAGLWARCWREGSTPEVRARLAIDPNVDWVAESRVADYLRGRVADGELTCFDATTIPVYWDVDVGPSTRYIYLNNILNLFPDHAEQVRAEAAASRQRYIVIDWTKHHLSRADEETLPADGEPAQPEERPFLSQQVPGAGPIVFRAGRYLVHRVRGRE